MHSRFQQQQAGLCTARFHRALLYLKATIPPVVVVACLAHPGMAREPRRMGATPLREAAIHHIQTGSFESGIPVFEELLRRYEHAGDDAGPLVESVLLYMGIGYLQKYGTARDEDLLLQARDAFDRCAADFPDGDRMHLLHLYRADCHRGLGDWERAAHDLEAALTKPGSHPLSSDQREDALEKLVQVLYHIQDWERGIPWFQKLLQSAEPDRRALAAAAMTEAAIATGNPDKIADLLPFLAGDSPARHDLRFNLKLMEGGDVISEEGYPAEAALLYALTLTRDELLAYWERRITRLEFKHSMHGRTGAAPSHAHHKIELLNARNQLETLNSMTSYTPELEWRKASIYRDTGRHWEAFWIFRHLADFYREQEDRIEDCLYAAFTQARKMDAFPEAEAIANRYLDREDWLRYRRELSVSFTGLLLHIEQYDRLIRFAGSAIARNPDDRLNAHLIYYLGTTYLRQERYRDLIREFTAYITNYPRAPMQDGCLYWSGLAMLITEEYESAVSRFNKLLSLYPESNYSEDARFRIGVARFADNRLSRAEEIFTEFITTYPNSILRGEGELFLGDIAGADGRVGKALNHYDAVSEFTTAQHLIDRAVFRKIQLLEANNRFRAMELTLREYRETHGEKGKLTEAIFEEGRALELMGQPVRMLTRYLDAILRYGNNPRCSGIDEIISAYPVKFQEMINRDPDTTAHLTHSMNSIQLPDELGALPLEDPSETYRRIHHYALEQGQTTLELRMAMGLEALGYPLNPSRLFSDREIEQAGPQTLVWIARQLHSHHNQSLRPRIRAVLQRAIHEFPEAVNTHADAWMLLGELAAAEEEVDRAVTCYTRFLDQYPGHPDAVRAVLRQGDVLAGAGLYDQAVEQYKRVLKTRSWRGEAWAEAQYRIGECHFLQDRFSEAHAYFERTFLAFPHYTRWAGRAYLKDAETLLRLGAREDARNTLAEALNTPGIELHDRYSDIRKLYQSVL